jgi:thioredoxin-like negative regulator of GroEL
LRASLHDDALSSYAGRFVWLEMNYDTPRNAAFMESHMNQGFPLVLIISPAGEVTMTWPGGATVAQLRGFLDEALKPSAPGKADEALRRGDERFGVNDLPGAVAAYREALKLGGDVWPRHDHAVEQLIGALQTKDQHECAAAALERVPLLPRDHIFVNSALMGVSCASGEPAEPAAKLEALAAEALNLPAASEDDRYMLFEALHAARAAASDKAGARALAEKYLAYVESRPKPSNDDQRLARDLALLRASIKLGEPQRAIPELEATERAIPKDDTPSSWLASAYVAAGRPDDALAAVARGLAKARGPTGSAQRLAGGARRGQDHPSGSVARGHRSADQTPAG